MLPLRLRALTGLATFAIERGWMPSPVAQLEKPQRPDLHPAAPKVF